VTAKINTMTWDLRTWRSNLRLASGLVLLSFVICHLSAHCVLLVSLESADAAIAILMYPWRTAVGTGLLLTAVLLHYANALWSIYLRRSLRLPGWEWAQLSLGLCIPMLLMAHVVGTRIAESVLDVTTSYRSVLTTQWFALPWLGIVQAIAVLTVWTHASIGIHFWLRTKQWYPRWRPALFGFALLLPALALAGFVAAGNEVLRAAGNASYVKATLQAANLNDQKRAEITQWAWAGWAINLALVALPFAGRGVRGLLRRGHRPPMLSHPLRRRIAILSGATVLETLRENGIPHASVCGGRGRCSTCRVLVTEGLDQLPEACGIEAKVLARLGATADMRLACQLYPTADISITPLLPADAGAAAGALRAGFEGRERLIAVVFVDIRGSTTLGEAKLPYDVLFILNRFFHEMSKAVAATNGHYSQFTGDGLMALYGLNAADPTTGPADAIRGAGEMLTRLDELNHQLQEDLPEPLRIGIGVHYGEAIVGAMGPPRSQIVTAIGDTVNTCARLESLSKTYDCAVVVSRRAAEIARLDLVERELHEVPVKGRLEPVQFYTIKTLADLAASTAAPR
jgi:adenylate cyclase